MTIQTQARQAGKTTWNPTHYRAPWHIRGLNGLSRWHHSESPKPPHRHTLFMRSTVTGGAGFIGSNLADTLSQNHDVVIIDNLATGRRENIEHLLDHPRVTFVEGSISLEVPALRLQNRKSPLHR